LLTERQQHAVIPLGPSIAPQAPAPLRYVGVPPASPLAGVRTLHDRMPLETGSPRPAGR